MKKIGVICLLIVLIVFGTISGVAASSVETTAPSVEQNQQPSQASSTYGLDATASMLGLSQIEENLASAFLFDINSRTLMYAWNADQQLHPASLVKIMTALIALDKGNPDDQVIATEDVLSTIPGDAMAVDLLPGEVMSLKDLLHCMMAGSANDAAAVIAAHISGSQEAFVSEMNRYASDIGCTGTIFTNPHGLHDPDQYMTARDVGKVLDAALSREGFMEFFSAVHYTVPATNLSEARYLASSNFLMNNDTMTIYFDERVTGGRTGVNQDGKRCVAATAEKDGMQLICVVMGAESTFDDSGRNITIYGGFEEVSSLLDRGTEDFKIAQLLYANQALEQRPVHNGLNDVILGPMVDHTAVIPSGTQMKDITLRYLNSESLTAPIMKGDKVSTVEVFCGGMLITVADLYALNSVDVKSEAPAADSNRADPNATAVWVVILSVTGVCILVAAVIWLFPRIKFARENRRNRRYRRNRRRSR